MGQSRILVSIEDLALDQQCASWSLISSKNKLDRGMRYNYPKNRMDLERTVVQQMEYIQWREITKFRIVKSNLVSAICRLNSSIWPHTEKMAVRLNWTPFSWRSEWKAIRYLGKILPENTSDLPKGSSKILINLRCPPRRLPMPV